VKIASCRVRNVSSPRLWIATTASGGPGFEFAEELQSTFDASAPSGGMALYSGGHGVVSLAASLRSSVSDPFDRILVVAIMHLKRDPTTWRERAGG